MSTTYQTLSGDTFESIARGQLGDDTKAVNIRNANPSVSEPIQTGTTVTIPDLAGAPRDNPQSLAGRSEDPDQVSMLIEGKTFRFWQNLQIRRSIDRVSTIAFSTPFDPEDKFFRDTFKPIMFRRAVVRIGGGNAIFTGTLLTADPDGDPTGDTVPVNGYGEPGILGDCPAPASAYPLEFNGLDLHQIAEIVCGFYGIHVEFLTEPGAVFKRVALEPDKKALPFLMDLAQQRNIVLTDTPDGTVIFWQSDPGGLPVVTLRQGEQNALLKVKSTTKPQEYYSDVSAIQTVKMGSRGAQYTATNPRLDGVVRPFTFVAKDARGGDLQKAADAKLGRMFANVVSYRLSMDTWRDPAGELWEPNTTLKLLYPSAMVYNETEFLIRDVTLSASSDSNTAQLEVVLPGAFSGQVPEVLPWD